MIAIACALLLLLSGMPAALAGPDGPLPLLVIYVGEPDSARGRDFADFLTRHCRDVQLHARASFDPKSAAAADVVLLDWPQQQKPDQERRVCPLGERSAWKTPTVLLGSAGLNLAVSWDLKGWFG